MIFWLWNLIEAVVQRCSLKKVFLNISQNSPANACANVSLFMKAWGLQQACNFIKKNTLAQLFSWEFCEISKNTFFRGTTQVAASQLKC